MLNETLLQINDRELVRNIQAPRGRIFRREIVVRNHADQDVTFDAWIEVDDRKSQPLLDWHRFTPDLPLHLPAKSEEKMITLNVMVPAQAKLGTYKYTVVYKSNDLSANRTRRTFQLQIVAAELETELSATPGFELSLRTTSEKPFPLVLGQELRITARIENRSERTDRYYLTCPGFPQNWYRVEYEEIDSNTFGVIQHTDGLRLNKQESGEVTLIFCPDQTAKAGVYFPTVQLTSENHASLNLLGVVYFKLLPSEKLQAELIPTIRRIPEDPGQFQIRLVNSGNIRRTLTIQASDQQGIFHYDVQQPTISLEPNAEQLVELRVKPRSRHRWQRPLWGKPTEVPFTLTLLNQASETYNPELPTQLPQGLLIWQPRSLQFLALLIFLGANVLVSTLLGVLYYFNRPAIAKPKILAFQSVQREYSEGGKDAIALQWETEDAGNLEQIAIARLEKGAETYRKVLNLSQCKTDVQSNVSSKKRTTLWQFSLPPIWFFSGLQYNPTQTKTIRCTNVMIPTPKVGEYNFRLDLFETDNRSAIASQTTDSVTVRAAALPQILRFAPVRTLYPENPKPGIRGPIQLNWEIQNINAVREIQITGFRADGSPTGEVTRYRLREGNLPNDLSSQCQISSQKTLICREVPTLIQQAGDYIFKLSVVSQTANGATPLMQATDPIRIQEPSIKIASFTVNGQEALNQPKQMYAVGRDRAAIPIGIGWKVEGNAETAVELLPAPGRVPLQGSVNSAVSGTETITIVVTQRNGTKLSQSVVVQAIPVDSPSSPDPTVNPSPRSEENGSEEGSTSERFEPIELPPQP
jgi:hypothetical protein